MIEEEIMTYRQVSNAINREAISLSAWVANKSLLVKILSHLRNRGIAIKCPEIWSIPCSSTKLIKKESFLIPRKILQWNHKYQHQPSLVKDICTIDHCLASKLTFIVCAELILKYLDARFSSSMVFNGCGGYFSFSCCLTLVTCPNVMTTISLTTHPVNVVN